MSEQRGALITRYRGVRKAVESNPGDESIREAMFHATADLGLWNRSHPDEPIKPIDTL